MLVLCIHFLEVRARFGIPTENNYADDVALRTVSMIDQFLVLNFRGKVTTNQRHYMGLCEATSLEWNFSRSNLKSSLDRAKEED